MKMLLELEFSHTSHLISLAMGLPKHQRKTKLVLLESPSDTERMICKTSQAVGSGMFEPVIAASSGELLLPEMALTSSVAWPLELLDEMEVQELSVRVGNWK